MKKLCYFLLAVIGTMLALSAANAQQNVYHVTVKPVRDSIKFIFLSPGLPTLARPGESLAVLQLPNDGQVHKISIIDEIVQSIVRIEAEKWTTASSGNIAARVEDHLTVSPAYSNLGMTPLAGWTSYKLALPGDMNKARLSWARNTPGTINVQLRAGVNATAAANELLASFALTTTLDWQIYQPAPVTGFMNLSRPLKNGETLWITYTGLPQINIDWIELSK